MCQPDNLRQGRRGDNFLGRGVMKEDAVGKDRVQLPLVRKPCPDLAVMHAELLDLMGAERRFVVAACEEIGIRFADGGEQDQLADVVQQAGEIRFFRSRVVDRRREIARELGDHQRMAPERLEIRHGLAGAAIEQALDRQAGGDRAHQACAERDQAIVETVQLAATAQRRRVRGGENARGQARIVPDQRGELGHRRAVVVDQMHQTQKNLRR